MISRRIRPPSSFRTYRRELKEEVERALGSSRLGLYDMVRASGLRSWRGLPPLLCLASSRSVSGDYHPALPAAAALELASKFWWLHQGLWGRAFPKAFQRWGWPQAINAGDALFALARLTLFRLEEKGLPPEQVEAALHLLDEAFLRACRGRALELLSQGRPQPQLRELEAAGRDEAGAIFRCSLEMGALVGGGAQAIVLSLGEFGEELGTAYYLRRAGLEGPEPLGLIEEHVSRGLSSLKAAALPREREQELRRAAEYVAGPPFDKLSAHGVRSERRDGVRRADRADKADRVSGESSALSGRYPRSW